MKKIFFPVLVVVLLLVGGYFGLKSYMVSSVQEDLDQEIAKVSDTLEITYGDLDVNLFNQSLVLNDVNFKVQSSGESVSIETFIVNDIDQDNDFPTYVDFEIRNMVIKDFGHLFPSLFSENGLTDIGVNFSLAYNADPEKKSINVSKLGYGIEGMFFVEGGVSLQNFNFFNFNDLGNLQSLLGVEVESANINFTNDEFFNLVLEDYAKKNRMNVDSAKENLRNLLSLFGNNAPNEKIKNNANEIKKFIDNPRSIRLDFKPDKPMSPYSMAFFIKALGEMTIVAE